jgi:hypothetical protein
MEEIQLINRIRNTIEEIFALRFYNEDEMEIETLMFFVMDDLSILEEWMEEEKMTIREIKMLVEKMITAEQRELPKIMFKIDEMLKRLLEENAHVNAGYTHVSAEDDSHSLSKVNAAVQNAFTDLQVLLVKVDTNKIKIDVKF